MKGSYLLIGVIAVGIIAVLAWVASNRATLYPSPTPVSRPTVTTPEATQPAETPTSPSAQVQQAREIVVSGSSFKFEPSTLRVKKGERVRVVFKNTGGFHDLTLAGYNLATKRVAAGSQDALEFAADKSGTFEFYCSVPGHKEDGMVGKLIVE